MSHNCAVRWLRVYSAGGDEVTWELRANPLSPTRPPAATSIPRDLTCRTSRGCYPTHEVRIKMWFVYAHALIGIGFKRQIAPPARRVPAGAQLKPERAGVMAPWPAPETWSSRTIGTRCPRLNGGSVLSQGV